MNKKITITIGATIATIAPLATVVACGKKDAVQSNEVGEFSLNSSKNLFTTRRAATQDVATGVSEKVAEAITSTNNTNLSKQLSHLKGHDKIKLLINFADAKLAVDAQVKLNRNHYAVTVNKVYTQKGNAAHVDMTSETGRSNIAEYKRHVKTLLETLVAKSNDANATPESIKQIIRETYSIAAGLKEIHIAPNTGISTPPFQGSQGAWNAVAYERNIFVFTKDSTALSQLLETKSPAYDTSTIVSDLDLIETAIRNYAKTLTSDSIYGAFAAEEVRLEAITPTPQSQITVGTFMSLEEKVSDDMVAIGINGLSLANAKALLTNATHVSGIKVELGKLTNPSQAQILLTKIIELLKI